MAACPGAVQAHLRHRRTARLPPLANDGKQSTHLPEGTPFGLVGTSSLYKRESYPYGVVRPGKVTADATPGRQRPFAGWHAGLRRHRRQLVVQGADAGLYENSDIHAIRILALEPTTERQDGPSRPALLEPCQ